jgi:hypothetical protein
MGDIHRPYLDQNHPLFFVCYVGEAWDLGRHAQNELSLRQLLSVFSFEVMHTRAAHFYNLHLVGERARAVVFQTQLSSRFLKEPRFQIPGGIL